MNDQDWMLHALALAKQAEQQDEVPVGAVIVMDGRIIGEGSNAPILNNDATAHAEVQAIRAACNQQNNYRLPDSTLYVTLEPCSMCAGAIIHARIARVVIAAREPRAGAAGSVLNVLNNDNLNHRCVVEFGLCSEESSSLLKAFFKRRRKKS